MASLHKPSAYGMNDDLSSLKGRVFLPVNVES